MNRKGKTQRENKGKDQGVRVLTVEPKQGVRNILPFFTRPTCAHLHYSHITIVPTIFGHQGSS